MSTQMGCNTRHRPPSNMAADDAYCKPSITVMCIKSLERFHIFKMNARGTDYQDSFIIPYYRNISRRTLSSIALCGRCVQIPPYTHVWQNDHHVRNTRVLQNGNAHRPFLRVFIANFLRHTHTKNGVRSSIKMVSRGNWMTMTP